jgi:hypothetical protein
MSVTLRRVEPADYPLIQRWQNDPEVFARMDYERPFSLEDIQASEEQATREGTPFIIEADGRPVGRIGLNQFRRRDRTAALYLFIGERDAWGKGYGRAALEALLTYAFETEDLRLVHLYSLADNDPAIALYKSVGFVEEARLRDRSYLDGRFVDHAVMSITRDEFMSRNGA